MRLYSFIIKLTSINHAQLMIKVFFSTGNEYTKRIDIESLESNEIRKPPFQLTMVWYAKTKFFRKISYQERIHC